MASPNFVIARDSKGFVRQEESVENLVQSVFQRLNLLNVVTFI